MTERLHIGTHKGLFELARHNGVWVAKRRSILRFRRHELSEIPRLRLDRVNVQVRNIDVARA